MLQDKNTNSQAILGLILRGDRTRVDALGRPMSFYSRRVHDSCYRRPYYDAGLFVESFDDENARRGYCLYKMGCRGPTTYNSCGIIRWNSGVSYPIQSGHGCIGCSEASFWDNGPFYQHLASFPGFGIETTADTVGVAVGAALASVAVFSSCIWVRMLCRHFIVPVGNSTETVVLPKSRIRGVPLFDRFAIMKLWAELGTFDFTTATNKLDMAQHVHDCIGRLLADLVVEAAKPGGPQANGR